MVRLELVDVAVEKLKQEALAVGTALLEEVAPKAAVHRGITSNAVLDDEFTVSGSTR